MGVVGPGIPEAAIRVDLVGPGIPVVTIRAGPVAGIPEMGIPVVDIPAIPARRVGPVVGGRGRLASLVPGRRRRVLWRCLGGI